METKVGNQQLPSATGEGAVLATVARRGLGSAEHPQSDFLTLVLRSL